ncbi:MAG TPA: DAK2 domain-containing protein [Propionibacteriaceae bacterium]|nr:DAK2 domain-containing protein [Propionibacteriaceae bacterium]
MALEPAASPKPPLIDVWAVGDAWLRRAEEIIAASADALNVMNVFPVPDSDTGSNLKLTMRGMTRAVPEFGPNTVDALVQAAILSAHGNSGAIVAEMFTSVCRALQQHGAGVRRASTGSVVALLFRTVADAATQAVARPVAGTILTVAEAAARAAQAAAGTSPDGPLAVALAAQAESIEALARTKEQLEVLGRAGVVDAGGQAFVLLVDCLVEVLGGPPAQPLEPAVPSTVPSGSTPPVRRAEYEVMYALRGASRESLDRLRADLSELGNSVVIVGDKAVAQVHVHLVEPGRAIEAALDRGRLSQIRITALDDLGQTRSAARSVVSVVAGPGIADAVRQLGGVPLTAGTPTEVLQQLEGVVEQSCGDLIVLPNDLENLELARQVAAAARTAQRRVAVIPTVVQMQGLAAIAVHEPTTEFDAAVVAMSTAAGHARHGAITIAERPAMTMAGRCEVGDVLGVVDGDFVEIGDSVPEVAWRVVQRLLGFGGELLTVVAGAGCEEAVVDELERRTRSVNAAMEVERISGGQQRYVLLMGLE